MTGTALQEKAQRLNERLARLSPTGLRMLVATLLLLVGLMDWATGYELGFSLFYLFPVAIAAWHLDARHALLVSLLSCISWALADVLAGHRYSHPLFVVWNASIRLGFFLVCGMLLVALRQALTAAHAMARTDALTGLSTRRVFDARLAHDIEICRRSGRPLSVAYMDLDDFKAVNDQRGHAEGDRVLGSTARLLSESTRRADTPARLGGDEFAVVLPDTGTAGAQEFATRFARAFEQAFAGLEPSVGVSVGIVTFYEMPVDAAAALAEADALMYEVKRSGKRRTICKTV